MRIMTGGFRSMIREWRFLAGFLVFNAVLAWLGAMPFRAGVSAAMGHSLQALRLKDGFDPWVVGELLGRPEMGQGMLGMPLAFALIFALASLLLMPGLIQAFVAGERLPREAFLIACGRNVGKFARLAAIFIASGAVLGGLLGAAGNAVMGAAARSTRERVPFWAGLGLFLASLLFMTLLRMLFDLAQAHVVVREPGAVRRSLAAAFRLLRTHGARLLGVYLLVTFLAAAALCGGLWGWCVLVPSRGVFAAFLTSQGILGLLLAARFWQRAAAVALVLDAR